MPVDPQRLAQDARVIAALKQFGDDWASDDEARSRDYLLATICAAHLDALAAGEGLDWPAMFQEALDGASTPTNAFQSFSVPEVARDIIDRHHRAIVGALRAKLAAATDRIARLEEPWTDEHGTAWLAPTAHAYAMTCKALDEKREKLAVAEARVKELEGEVREAHDTGLRRGLREISQEAP